MKENIGGNTNINWREIVNLVPNSAIYFDDGIYRIIMRVERTTYELRPNDSKGQKHTLSKYFYQKDEALCMYKAYPCSEEELRRHRKKGTRGLAIKAGNELFFCKVSGEICLLPGMNFMGEDKCLTCKHATLNRGMAKKCRAVLFGSTRIEDMPFIRYGYQFVNVGENHLHVVTCNNYGRNPTTPCKKRTLKRIK